MEEWSIPTNHVIYVMHGESVVFHKLSIGYMNYRQDRDLYKRLNNKQTTGPSINFGKKPRKFES